MTEPARLYTHHAGCGCTFDQEDAPVDRCAAASELADRRREAMAAGDATRIRAADAAYQRHLGDALQDAKA